MTAAVEVSARTTAACADCPWTSGTLTGDLSIRVAARQHADLTQHPVAVLSNTITVLHPERAGDAVHAAVVVEAARIAATNERAATATSAAGSPCEEAVS